MNRQALPYIVLTGILFGGNLVAGRLGIRQIDPLTYVGLRLGLASLGYLAIYLFFGQRHPWPTDRRLWKHGVILGLTRTAIPVATFTAALQFQSSGVTALLVAAGPALTILLAHFFLADEILTPSKGLGVALALGGALLLVVRGETGLPDVSRAEPIVYGLLLLGLFSISGATIYTRKAASDFRPLDVTSIQMLTSALVILGLALLGGGLRLEGLTLESYLAVAYAAFLGTFLAFLLFFHNVQRFGATAGAMSEYIVPLVAGLGGVLLLDEQITVWMLLSLLLIAAGLALINHQRQISRSTPQRSARLPERS